LMVKFIEFITDACLENRQFPFRILLTSRVEEHLWMELEDRSIVYLLDLRHFDASDDICRFFRSRFPRIYGETSWPSNSEVEALVEKAEGSFLRAVKIVNFLADRTDDPHRKLTAALRAATDFCPRHSPSYPRLLGGFKWLSRSSSQHTSTSVSSRVNPRFSTTGSISGGGGSSRADHGAPAVRLWINTSGVSVLYHTPGPAVLSESPISLTEDDSIKMATLEGLVERLILPCASIHLKFYHLSHSQSVPP
jgi:hypothetical protein